MHQWVITGGATVLAAALTGAIAWWTARNTQRTTDVDVFTKSAVSLIAPLKLRIETLESDLSGMHLELTKLREELAASERERLILQRWATALQEQLIQEKIKPIPIATFRTE